MPVPKKRTSKSKKNMRRSHHRVAGPGMSVCPNCGSIKHPHSVCEACGHYRGKQVVEPKSNLGFEDAFQAEA